MATDVVSPEPYDIDRIKTAIKPWTAPNGSIRYYVDTYELIDDYRTATDTQLNGYYDWVDMRASPERVKQRIEENIIPKTKTYFDTDGFLHIYGYGVGKQSFAMGLPYYIFQCANYFYGTYDYEHYRRMASRVGQPIVYKSWEKPLIGDMVRVVKGRKKVGYRFTVAKITTYSYSQYAWPSVTLWDAYGFKVNMDNCIYAIPDIIPSDFNTVTKPYSCEIHVDVDGSNYTVNNIDEFKALVKPYLNNGYRPVAIFYKNDLRKSHTGWNVELCDSGKTLKNHTQWTVSGQSDNGYRFVKYNGLGITTDVYYRS